MGLFVALDPPQAALAELQAEIASLRERWPGLRWIGSDRWHVTLAFLGDVPAAKLDGLSARLERACARHPSPLLRMGRGGAFPSAAKARVLISHLDELEAESGEPAPGRRYGLAGLAALAASVSAAARRAGAPPPDDGRRYTPHLTLARSEQPAEVSELVQALSGFSGQAWTATHAHLVKSQLGPAPRYDTLGSWPLQPADD